MITLLAFGMACESEENSFAQPYYESTQNNQPDVDSDDSNDSNNQGSKWCKLERTQGADGTTVCQWDGYTSTCSNDSETKVTTHNEYGYAIEVNTESVSGQTTAYSRIYDCQDFGVGTWCILLEVVNEDDGQTTTTSCTFNEDDMSSSCDTETFSVLLNYNEFGYFVRMQTFFETSTTDSVQTFDCTGWPNAMVNYRCKMLTNDVSYDGIPGEQINCDWEENTQTCVHLSDTMGTNSTSVTEYNDYGFPKAQYRNDVLVSETSYFNCN